MASDRRVELEEALVRPGTYFNPQTEVMIVVDDSSSIDTQIWNLEEFEGADWVLISDEHPIDEARRDVLFETFQATYHGGDGRGEDESAIDDLDDDDETLKPDDDEDDAGSVPEE